MEVHVQFSDSLQTTIIAEFGCPQDPALYPDQETIDSSDARYEAFINPAPPPPSVVTMRQARLALLKAGKLQAVSDVIATLPSSQREAAQIEWDFASQVERDSPFFQQMANALGMNAEALDALFIAAAAL
ncbi:hypothetical protein [Variovorax atrisoli]|uniref:hypothetical protein n=1 Tax=Variovorax atrisoli TaxID=3394203 RepID=UPI0033947439